MNPRAAASLASIALVLALGIAYMSLGVLEMDPRRETITLDLRLSDSAGLGPNAPVLVNGVETGHVETVHRTPGAVSVRLRIDRRHRIPAASGIRIEQLSALGEPYIEFDPDNDDGPYLQDGQQVPTSRVQAPMTIPTLSARMVELLDQIDPDTVARLLDTFHRTLAGTDTAIATLQRSTTLLAAVILTRRDTLRQLLTDLQHMGADISWLGPALTDAGPQFARFGQALSAVIESASVFIEARPTSDYFTGDGIVSFLDNLTTYLHKIGPDIAPVLPALQPLLDQTLTHTPTIDINTLLDQALDSINPDGTPRFRITLK
ncbi:MlaD family protein [Nocardia bovistercoris]|uniref:MCE family protein n=1 Tax=Nocardia bovistercoris TaxID=2785916 RepID=A0A931N6L3_9NOCA|nr:MlaD family protein [Nocardia bovistercoris]MBH0780651.1 MCE family protein [Nocardia bovistercoris]